MIIFAVAVKSTIGPPVTTFQGMNGSTIICRYVPPKFEA
jgi:hypothetical protein